jgi:hypothetical protein
MVNFGASQLDSRVGWDADRRRLRAALPSALDGRTTRWQLLSLA